MSCRCCARRRRTPWMSCSGRDVSSFGNSVGYRKGHFMIARGFPPGALGGTRTPTLLIRSSRHGPARSKRARLTWVWSAAQDGHRASGLLYLAAVRDDLRQQERCQARVDSGLSAWELACHASLTGASQVSCHLRLSASARRVPVLTALSG